MHTEITSKQLDILNTKPRFFGKIKVQDHINALDQIGEFGAPYDVMYIIHHVFSKNRTISQKTASVIRKLLTKPEIIRIWPNLYASFSYYDCYGDDNLFSKEKLKSLANFIPEEAAHLYGVASLNYSGYIREEALNYLGKLPTSEVLPYILLRLNDWVPEVRNKANEILTRILPNISVTDLIKYHTLIEWLGKTKRINLKDVQSRIFKQINNPQNREELLKAMQKEPVRIRFFCWKVLVEEITKDNNLIDKAIKDPAPLIRQWIASNLQNITDKNRLSILLNDSAIRVRYATLRRIPKQDFLKYKEFYETAIFDDSKPIREYARFMLSLHGNGNHVEKYRLKLSASQGQVLTGVMIGLSETGTEEDIPVIRAFINHRNAKVRAAGLYGLNRLRVKGIDNLYLSGLQDNSAKVRNACISILQSGYSHLRTELENLLKNKNSKLQKAVLEILSNYRGLDSLKNILFALTQDSEELQIIAWQYLATWHSRYARKLSFSFSKDTYKSIIQLLEKLKEMNVQPPHPSYYVFWNDLPNIMNILGSIHMPR